MKRESERYSRTGSISADGVSRLLGTPDMDLLELMVRESVQNAWDARLGRLESPPTPLPQLRYEIRIRNLTRAQRDVLRALLSDLPEPQAARRSIESVLGADTIRVMEVSDFGTVGLGGPLDPGEPPRGRSTDYVDFIRNLGTPHDTGLRGGTYGYGKSCLHQMSACATILVDSFAHEDQERRLVAYHLGERYDIDGQGEQARYTGRHWWGAEDLGPLTGDPATAVARSLGLPERGPESTGTTILVLAPELDEEAHEPNGDEAMALPPEIRIHELLLWNLWPKMLPGPDGRPAMAFRVTKDGFEEPIRDPAMVPPLNLFVAAMKALKAGEGTNVKCGRPKKDLGTVMFTDGPARARIPQMSSRFREPAHHVALMRPAELVVTYKTGPLHLDPDKEWAGVFICSDVPEIEHAFARSEPPAHEDWVPASLPSRSHARTYVRVALREIAAACRGRFGEEISDGDLPSPGGGLAGLARRLGRSLASVAGAESGGGRNGGGGGGRRGRKNRKIVPHRVDIRAAGGFVESEWKFEPQHGGFATGDKLSVQLRYLLQGGGSTDELPTYGSPEVLGWRDAEGVELPAGPTVRAVRATAHFMLRLKHPEDLALKLVVSVENTAGQGTKS